MTLMVRPEAQNGAVLILAPVGRDAAAIAGLVERAQLKPIVCSTTADMVTQLDRTRDVAIVAEEALYGTSLEPVEQWVAHQPTWSDQPFIVLTNRNEGPRFGAFRRELVARLRNVTFLERPLQGMTLQATVLSAERARRRQYQIRAYLDAQRDASAQLERLVAERTADLEQANSQLRAEISRREREQAALLQEKKIEALGKLRSE